MALCFNAAARLYIMQRLYNYCVQKRFSIGCATFLEAAPAGKPCCYGFWEDADLANT